MSVFDRIRQRVKEQQGDKPVNVGECINNVEKWRREAEEEQKARFEKQFKEHDLKNAVDRSGILPLHQRCTIANYQVNNPGQNEAKRFAGGYADHFANHNGKGFIFSGESGTGKNHLAAAICNQLIGNGYSCLVITVSELMMNLRKCYQKDAEMSEDGFFRAMNQYDLLILDEIGLQRGTTAENLAINQIVDQRICRMKPTGMLTNLDAKMINDVLGVRIMDRMRMNGGAWIPFTWNSYRK